MKPIYRPTWAEINLEYLWHNVLLAQKNAPDKIMIPVIKANAYGHGAIEVMKYLYAHEIRYVAVSLLEEALELRDVFHDIDILMLGPIMPEDLKVASKNHIEITIYNDKIYQAIKKVECWITCHIKVDSGMARYGLTEPEKVASMIEDLQLMEHVSLKGIYTHFATANNDESYYHMQLERFKLILDTVRTLPPMIHISNSSSTLKYEKNYDFTTHFRLGISLYGLSLDHPKPDLKPVMSLKSKVVQIKELNPFECVGYGATYCAKEHEKIGILPIGYADGFIRKNKSGSVEINNKLYKLIGTICMDACFIKIDDSVSLGDTVTLYGGMITIDDVAKRLQTINYEVCTSLSYRVPRVMIKGGKHD